MKSYCVASVCSIFIFPYENFYFKFVRVLYLNFHFENPCEIVCVLNDILNAAINFWLNCIVAFYSIVCGNLFCVEHFL